MRSKFINYVIAMFLFMVLVFITVSTFDLELEQRAYMALTAGGFLNTLVTIYLLK